MYLHFFDEFPLFALNSLVNTLPELDHGKLPLDIADINKNIPLGFLLIGDCEIKPALMSLGIGVNT